MVSFLTKTEKKISLTPHGFDSVSRNHCSFFDLSIYHWPSPSEGPQANTTLKDYFTLQVGELGKFGLPYPSTVGKTVGFVKEIKLISSFLKSRTRRLVVWKIAGLKLSPVVKIKANSGLGGLHNLRYWYVNPFPSLYSLYVLQRWQSILRCGGGGGGGSGA